MFYTLILENETGQQVDLSRTANRYMFSKIKGLNPPTGTVSTSSYAGMNGSYLNNAFIEKRNVVIPFEMRGFDAEATETVRATTIVKTLHIRPSGFEGENSNVPPTLDLYQQLLEDF